MKAMKWIVLAWLLAAAPLAACPACSNAKPIKREGSNVPTLDPRATSQAFNLSIYFMLGTVYGVPTLLGLALWRTISSHQARRRDARARVVASNPIEMSVIRTVPAGEEAGS